MRKILRTETISTRSILKGLQMSESSNTKYKVCTKIFKEINNGLQNMSKGSETVENIQADLTKNQIKLLEMKSIIIDIKRHS